MSSLRGSNVNEEVLPVADDGYRAVGFSYGYQDESKEPKNEDVETIYRPPFPVPESLSQNLPPTEKVHQIIARTATFVSEHGGQSEIVLRVKQGNNPTFGFLMPDHNLHPYFRFLVDHQELPKPDGDGEREKAGAENSGQTGGALSLLGSIYGYDEEEDGAAEDLPNAKISKSPENVEAISSTVSQGSESSGNTSVKNQTVLNNSMKEKVNAIKRNPSINSVKSVAASMTIKTQTPSAPLSIAKVELPVVEPPSELKRVVEKIVEFILRNGKEFEAVLAEQDRKYGRFPFLLPTSIYHSYYLQVLQKTQESKLTSKASVSEKHEPTKPGKEKKTSRRDIASPSTGISNRDIPNDYDKKEKFKMALGKPKNNEQEPPPKVNQQPSEIVLDAEVTAAILKAATRGIKNPILEIFSKQNAVSEAQSTSEAEVDSSEASLTKEQRVKAERLKRAKLFAAMIKNGAAPLKPDPSRGLSVEPAGSGVSSSGKVDSASADLDASEEIKRLEKKAVIDECTERRSRRTYRPRSSREEEEEEAEDGEEDERDYRRSRKKHRSHRSSRHSRDRHSHKRRSSVDCDDDDDHDDDRRRVSRKRRKDYNGFSDDEDRDHCRRSRAEKRRESRSSKEGEVEEDEILYPSKKTTVNETGREPSADSPSESTVVPDDLRAKVRAMLMATM